MTAYEPAALQNELLVQPASLKLSPERLLSLREAIKIALQRHPVLTAANLEVDARNQEAQQANLLPNPEVQTDIENFGGRGSMSGFDGAETTVTIGQLIELGGKRSRRVEAAQLQARLAGWDVEAQRIALYTEVTKLYVAAVAADRKLIIAEELFSVAKRLRDAVQARVEAGKVSPIENQRALIVVGRAETDRDAAKAQKRAAYRSLASSLSATPGEIGLLSGRLDGVFPPPSHDAIAGLVSESPTVARWSAEIASRLAALDLERANRVPDVTIGGGVRNFSDTGDIAYVATFSMPLPLFNRNQGAVSAARDRLARSRAEAANARIAADIVLDNAYADLSAAATRALALKDRLLPASKQTFEATQSGYEEGKFDLVTLLDAQRTYFEVETDAIDAAAAYFDARADVEALIGRDLSSINPSGEDRQQ